MTHSRMNRRHFLRLSALIGGSAALAACAVRPVEEAPSQAGQPQPTSAPAPAGGKVQVLHRQEYFKDLENQYKAQTEEYIRSLGYEPDVSTVNPEVFGDFMAKMQAAVAAGNPPDLAYHYNSPSQMRDLDLVGDHTDIVNTLTEKYGDPVPVTVFDNVRFDGVWYSVPHSSNAGAWFIRKDWAQEAGVEISALNKKLS